MLWPQMGHFWVWQSSHSSRALPACCQADCAELRMTMGWKENLTSSHILDVVTSNGCEEQKGFSACPQSHSCCGCSEQGQPLGKQQLALPWVLQKYLQKHHHVSATTSRVEGNVGQLVSPGATCQLAPWLYWPTEQMKNLHPSRPKRL